MAEQLYVTLVGQAREPAFYRDMGVPDTPLGRFEMISLHAFLLFRRLRGVGQSGRALGQGVHDVMFADMDRSLREMGVGDLGVGKRVKKLASNLYGRIEAYNDGMDEEDGTGLDEALQRNVFAETEVSPEQVRLLADYMRRLASALATQEDDALMSGRLQFAPVEA